MTGRLAHYIVEERRYDSKKANFYTQLQHIPNDQISLYAGLHYSWYKGENFKVVDDLLGGEFYIDYDKFAERDFPNNSDAIQNDLNNPNRILKEGDKFGYSYDANVRYANAWVQLQYSLSQFDFFVGGNLSRSEFWRTGNFRNGKFPDASFGDSEKYDFTNYGAKAGITYKIDGRNYLYASGIYQTRAPYFRNSFVSPRTRNQAVRDLTSETIRGGEIGYNLRAPYFKGRITAYYTQFLDQTFSRSFYHDDENSFVNFSMTGINKEHKGIEAAAEVTLFPGFKVNGVASIGQYIFDSRPNATISQDNNAEVLQDDITIYAKNFYVSGTPQTAYTFGLSYRNKSYWSFYLNLNYFDDVWIDFNPVRRSAEAVDLVEQGSGLWRQIIEQEKTESAFTANASINKSFRLDWGEERTYLNIGLSVNNFLNNEDFITGGYEQLRFDFEEKDVDRFPSRYYYFQGLNYFLNIYLRF
jgi:hypothetical protein